MQERHYLGRSAKACTSGITTTALLVSPAGFAVPASSPSVSWPAPELRAVAPLVERRSSPVCLPPLYPPVQVSGICPLWSRDSSSSETSCRLAGSILLTLGAVLLASASLSRHLSLLSEFLSFLPSVQPPSPCSGGRRS